MNKVIIMGRLVRDPEIKYYNKQDGTQGTTTKISVAVDRIGKDAGADFIPCTAFGKVAEFIGKYFNKGSKIVIEGKYTTGSYEKDGTKHYTTEVTVERAEFAESKSAGNSTSTPTDQSGFINIPDSIDEELPFK